MTQNVTRPHSLQACAAGRAGPAHKEGARIASAAGKAAGQQLGSRIWQPARTTVNRQVRSRVQAGAERTDAQRQSPRGWLPKLSLSELLGGLSEQRARQVAQIAQQEQQNQHQDVQQQAVNQHQQLNGNGSASGRTAAEASEESGGNAAELFAVTSPEAAVALAAFEKTFTRRRKVSVRFSLKYVAAEGQRVKVVGTHKALGKWELQHAPELERLDRESWQATLQLPAGIVTEYKFAVLDSSGKRLLAWQQGNNSVLAVRLSDKSLEVFDTWHTDPSAKIVAAGEKPATRESRLMQWAGDLYEQVATQRLDLRQAKMELAQQQMELKETKAQLAATQQRAAEAARRASADLAAKEAERLEAVLTLADARAMNEALQTQLSDTTASFHEALEMATSLMEQMNSQGADEEEEEEYEEEEDEEEEAAAMDRAKSESTVHGKQGFTG